MGKQVIVIESREGVSDLDRFASHVLELVKSVLIKNLQKMIERGDCLSYWGLDSPIYSEASVGLVFDGKTVSLTVGANLGREIRERWRTSYSPNEEDCKVIESDGIKYRKTMKGDCFYVVVHNQSGELLELFIDQIFDGERHNLRLTEGFMDELLGVLNDYDYGIN